jgi:TolB-like protein
LGTENRAVIRDRCKSAPAAGPTRPPADEAGMSLFAELKRRNVVKVGAAYLLVAWLVVQAASIGFPAFGAPPWVLRVFILVMLLGFPIALVMTWIFEMTPEGLKIEAAPSGNKRIVTIAIVLATLAVGWYYRGQPTVRTGAIPVGEVGAVAVPAAKLPNSIAVLPFVNMSADAGNQYFADGISEELLNVLVRVPGLGVASRTSSFAYKVKQMDAAQIARELKVSYILEGSVRKAGEKVRITAQLIDAVHDRHLWSETYDRELTDIFAIQNEIATAIVAALRGSLTTAKAAPAVKVRADTGNMQAYELYLKARENFIARRDLPGTTDMFQRVVQLDPKFARGWEGLAAVSSVAPSWNYRDRDYMALARQASDRALELDPSLSMPWAVRSQIVTNTWPIDFAASLADLDKAIAADPRNATAFLWRGIAWINLGFFDRALADLDRSIALEPNYLNAIRHKALALLLAGKEDEAFALYESGFAKGFVNSRSENFIAPLLLRGHRNEALLLMGVAKMAPELREAVLTKLEHPETPIPNARALVEPHAADLADPELQNLSLTHLYLWLGDYDSVGTSDDRASTTIVAWDRYPASFRNSPGMKRKLTNMGVPAYWRAKGFPPQCHPVGATDFNCD